MLILRSDAEQSRELSRSAIIVRPHTAHAGPALRQMLKGGQRQNGPMGPSFANVSGSTSAGL